MCLRCGRGREIRRRMRICCFIGGYRCVEVVSFSASAVNLQIVIYVFCFEKGKEEGS